MINHKKRPLVAAYGYEKNNREMIFLTPEKEITIKNCNKVLKKILPLCDGLKDIEYIKQQFKDEIEHKSIDKLIKILFEYFIMVDSTEYYQLFHKVSNNPMKFYNLLNSQQLKKIFSELGSKKYPNRLTRTSLNIKHTPLMKILEKRKSTRIFSNKKEIDFDTISGLVWSTYGKLRKTLTDKVGTGPAYNIPSGGRLYSIEQYILLLKKVDPLKKGFYYYDRDLNKCVELKLGDFKTQIIDCFDDTKKHKATPKIKTVLNNIHEIMENATIVQILTSRINRVTQKYANRGYRCVLLETGHAAQNAYLYCAENNLGIVEYGGFLDQKLAKFMGINFEKEIPLICTIVGNKDEF